MKKLMLYLSAALLAALALASCNREANTPETPQGDRIQTNIVLKAKTAETKTHIVATDNTAAGTSTYTSHWDDSGESLGMLLYKSGITSSDVPVELPGESTADGIVFHKSAVSVEAGTNKLFLFSPYSAYVSTGDNYLVANLKTTQSPLVGSFDPACDVMGYSTDNINVVEGEDIIIENITLQRPMAIVRVRLNCGVDDKAYGEKVSSIEMRLSASMPLTGQFKVTTSGSVDIVTPMNYVEATYDLSTTLIAIGDATCNSVYFVTLPVTIPSGTEITFTIETQNYSGGDAIVRTVTAESNMALQAGKVNVIDLKVRDKDVPEPPRYAGGTGEEGDPWLIATPEHLLHMAEDLTDTETKYFKMIEDVDMDGIEWVAPNNSDSFGKSIFFDGNDKTISNLTVGSGAAYPSFIGVLNGTIKNLVFDGAEITGGSNCAGVLAGYIGSASTGVTGTCSGITVKNSSVSGSKKGLGGMAGMLSKLSAPITDCHVINTTVTSTADRVGGLAGQLEKTFLVSGCTAENVTVSGSINIGGLVGVLYGDATDCTSSGSISSINTTSNTDIGLGGLAGYFENGKISKCSSSVSINQTTNGRDIGGLVGKMLAATIEKSFATGNVKGMQRNVGGLVGLVTLASNKAVISDCYCTGSVNANAYGGGLLGLYEKGTMEISRCYATGAVSGGFAMGGLIGFTGNAKDFKLEKSAAWNSAVTASSYGQTNWSSGAVIGVTHPNCYANENYRNPGMSLTVYCPPPTADWDHPDIEGTTHPLYQNSQTAPFTWAESTLTAASAGSNNVDAGRWAYHGKHVASGTTLSQLASSTLGWSSDVWNFSGNLPILK